MPPELTLAQRRAVVAICSLAVVVVQIDTTGVNVALPSIARDLGASTGDLQWVVAAYLIVLTSLLLFSGALGDRVGRKKVLMLGMTLFGLGSALCSVSVTPEMLIGMRALQAIGGSMLAPVALSIISNVFTDRGERAQAIGLWGAAVGVGMATGPIVGGLLVSAIDWRAVFWVNLPIVALAVFLIHRAVPDSRSSTHRSFDATGQLLAIVTLVTLTFAIIEGGELRFDAPWVLAAAGVSLVAGTAFLLVERRVSEPMLDLRFFASWPFSLATVIALLAFFSFGGFLFVATLYLQDIRGLSPLHAGIITLPMAAANVLLSPISGRIVRRFGPRPSMVGAAVVMAIGAISLTQLHANTGLPLFIVAGMCMGGGLGLVNAPVTNTAVTGMPANMAGVAGATASTARQLGQSLGVAILGALLNTRLQAGDVFTEASHPGWWLLLASAALIGTLAMLTGSIRAKSSAARVQALY